MTYNKSIITDFGGATPELSKLNNDIINSAISSVLCGITSDGDIISIKFTETISGGDEIILDGLIGSHDNTPIPINTTEFSRTEVNSSTYNILVSDEIIGVIYTQTSVCTITLPEISTIPGLQKNYVIVDEGGNAGINNIIIQTSGTDCINGSNIFTINGNFNSIRVYNNLSDSWFIG